ncbi:hypothetical protein ACSBR1_038925 [Camellia fascicularis]
MEDMMRQLQETMQAMQQDAACQAEVVAQQAELIARLQQQQQSQQVGACALHPPPPTVLTPGETVNIQEDTDVPTGPVPPPVLPQTSKTPAFSIDTPFESEMDPTTLKMSNLEKLFKRAQGVNSIPDIEDGYTDSAMTLPDRFKMPRIDRFDGSGDPMVHLRLFSDILHPDGLDETPETIALRSDPVGYCSHLVHQAGGLRKEELGRDGRGLHRLVFIQHPNRGHDS